MEDIIIEIINRVVGTNETSKGERKQRLKEQNVSECLHLRGQGKLQL